MLAEQQNYYPDLSFVYAEDEKIKFALDLKTTYRLPDNPEFCNGFTLGSHGEYFVNRKSNKNIQFPYGEYLGHFVLGIIYSRSASEYVDETRTYKLDELKSIVSVMATFNSSFTKNGKLPAICKAVPILPTLEASQELMIF